MPTSSPRRCCRLESDAACARRSAPSAHEPKPGVHARAHRGEVARGLPRGPLVLTSAPAARARRARRRRRAAGASASDDSARRAAAAGVQTAVRPPSSRPSAPNSARAQLASPSWRARQLSEGMSPAVDPTVEIGLAGGDLRPGPRAAQLDALLLDDVRTRLGRRRAPRCRSPSSATAPTSRQNRRLAGDLGDRAARVAGDDRTARLRLDDHSPELLDPRRRRAARNEHDVRPAVDVRELRRRSARRAARVDLRRPRAAARGRAPRPPRARCRRRRAVPDARLFTRARISTASVDTLLGHEAPEEAEHDLVVVERLVARMEDARRRIRAAGPRSVPAKPLPRATEAA